jgi:hypothetical protein
MTATNKGDKTMKTAQQYMKMSDKAVKRMDETQATDAIDAISRAFGGVMDDTTYYNYIRFVQRANYLHEKYSRREV